jgi:hypothetical protein
MPYGLVVSLQVKAQNICNAIVYFVCRLSTLAIVMAPRAILSAPSLGRQRRLEPRLLLQQPRQMNRQIIATLWPNQLQSNRQPRLRSAASREGGRGEVRHSGNARPEHPCIVRTNGRSSVRHIDQIGVAIEKRIIQCQSLLLLDKSAQVRL